MYSHIHQNMYDIYHNIKMRSDNTNSNFAILKLVIKDDSLADVYKVAIEKHNNNIINGTFADSGFDVYVPDDVSFTDLNTSKFIDMNIKCEMVYCSIAGDNISNCAFYLHPRSSISKTPLMLANHTGVIDAGYRGNIIGAFRCLSLGDNNNYTVSKHQRLLQICHSTLCPVYVVIVKEEELTTTERGAGGFGSTGV